MGKVLFKYAREGIGFLNWYLVKSWQIFKLDFIQSDISDMPQNF
ncbi:hypothetical protein [Arenibacter troitsensis]|uniref:Uncharacterized protein n=1 Tax=Arenibacter troitsensis TaxID=188872 RepID=A0A1X7IJA4_9FLAO|nr:hypothetical protein [Arenibacter troitsensis]SMG14682.1 hypothetical protein SAMN03080602_00891 [Arenibacter troitsensis]